MTDENITEAFALIRQHSNPLAHPLIDSIEVAWGLDREALLLRQTQINMLRALGVVGHDNQRWSRRAGLRAVES